MNKFVIKGELYSKKNSKQILWSRKKQSRFIGSSEAFLDHVEDLENSLFEHKVAMRKIVFEVGSPLLIVFKLYRKTRKPFDYINIVQGILDAMVKINILPDDNMNCVIPFFLPYEVSPDNPRTEIILLSKENIAYIKDLYYNSFKLTN